MACTEFWEVRGEKRIVMIFILVLKRGIHFPYIFRITFILASPTSHLYHYLLQPILLLCFKSSPESGSLLSFSLAKRGPSNNPTPAKVVVRDFHFDIRVLPLFLSPASTLSRPHVFLPMYSLLPDFVI